MDKEDNDKLVDGARTITLSSWQEYHQQVLNLKSKRGYVWRGQKRDEDSRWFLQSSFDRNVSFEDQLDRSRKLEHHLNNFKDTMNKAFPGLLPKDNIDVWALGQHYGLWTPLLDWTLSPYIALYFAFNEGIEQGDQNDCYRYVYALNRSLERLLSKQKKANEVISSDRSVPFIDRLIYQSPRFTAQKSILTKAFQGKDVGEYIRSFSRKRPDEVLIVKFKIPSKDRDECLYGLRLMNIDHASLLLDLRDVANCCNNKL